MKKDILIISIIIIGGLFSTGCIREGCTLSCASNYDSKAKTDDFSCRGCTDPCAANYCPEAIFDDSSCTYDSINLSFTFSHTVGTTTLEFDAIKYTNADSNNYSVLTLTYFISDITLHTSSGDTILIDDEHYVDARNNSTLTFSPSQKIPNGDYSYISFTFGLNSNKNITGAYPNAPENNMEWPSPMGGGYHYMKLEGKHDSSGTTKNYQVHMGPTMGNDYHIRVTLPSSFTADCNISTYRNANISMDINKWFETPNTLDLNDLSSIMGDMAMQIELQQNGADVFTVSI